MKGMIYYPICYKKYFFYNKKGMIIYDSFNYKIMCVSME